jgi:hypothetical protein
LHGQPLSLCSDCNQSDYIGGYCYRNLAILTSEFFYSFG